MKVVFRQSARDDITRQFRYYLVTVAAPETAIRFRDAVKLTIASLREHSLSGHSYALRNPQLKNLRLSLDSVLSAFIICLSLT